uniref:Uncharacterized protein n=2 Tax=Amphimedon queenslandica TaxID=400682 RepID=A0A1X7UW60_AMPQE
VSSTWSHHLSSTSNEAVLPSGGSILSLHSLGGITLMPL